MFRWSRAVPVGRFDAHGDRWIEQGWTRRFHTGSDLVDNLTVSTFNIWFDDYHAGRRFQAIADLLAQKSPDIMVFQEVTPRALDVLLAQSWVRAHYRRAEVTGAALGNYGMLVLSRAPIRKATYTRLPTRQARGYLTVEITVNGVRQKFVSVHLESGKRAHRLRARQLSAVYAALRRTEQVVLLGDFNMRDAENLLVSPQYRDLWPHLRPDDPGFTENTSVNLMRFDSKNKHRHVRFDRILLKGAAWTAQHIELLGQEPISKTLPRVFPSDHFGVLCRLAARPLPARS
ncbi:MAG: endonuclease/exonuclease/phosphatase family protein [Mycobacterium sp.]